MRTTGSSAAWLARVATCSSNWDIFHQRRAQMGGDWEIWWRGTIITHYQRSPAGRTFLRRRQLSDRKQLERQLSCPPNAIQQCRPLAQLCPPRHAEFSPHAVCHSGKGQLPRLPSAFSRSEASRTRRRVRARERASPKQTVRETETSSRRTWRIWNDLRYAMRCGKF